MQDIPVESSGNPAVNKVFAEIHEAANLFISESDVKQFAKGIADRKDFHQFQAVAAYQEFLMHRATLNEELKKWQAFDNDTQMGAVKVATGAYENVGKKIREDAAARYRDAASCLLALMAERDNTRQAYRNFETHTRDYQQLCALVS